MSSTLVSKTDHQSFSNLSNPPLGGFFFAFQTPENYLPIQGGDSGTSDDAVINVSEALSGASFEVANDYEFYVGFED